MEFEKSNIYRNILMDVEAMKVYTIMLEYKALTT